MSSLLLGLYGYSTDTVELASSNYQMHSCSSEWECSLQPGKSYHAQIPYIPTVNSYSCVFNIEMLKAVLFCCAPLTCCWCVRTGQCNSVIDSSGIGKRFSYLKSAVKLSSMASQDANSQQPPTIMNY